MTIIISIDNDNDNDIDIDIDIDIDNNNNNSDDKFIDKLFMISTICFTFMFYIILKK